jgi:hypothetical protein
MCRERILIPYSPLLIEMLPSNCYGSLNGWMVLVIQDLEIIVLIVKDRFGFASDIERGEWVRLAAKLQAGLFQVIAV